MNIYFSFFTFILLSFACFLLLGLFLLFLFQLHGISYSSIQQDQVACCNSEIKFTSKIKHEADKSWMKKEKKRKSEKEKRAKTQCFSFPFSFFFSSVCFFFISIFDSRLVAVTVNAGIILLPMYLRFCCSHSCFHTNTNCMNLYLFFLFDFFLRPSLSLAVYWMFVCTFIPFVNIFVPRMFNFSAFFDFCKCLDFNRANEKKRRRRRRRKKGIFNQNDR